MSKTGKIRVPYFIDDPIAGRYISFLPFGFHDYIFIEKGMLTYKPSTMSPNPQRTFDLKLINKILFLKRKVSYWTGEGKLDPSGRGGTKFVLYLVDVNGERHELIPDFSMNFGQKRWERFLGKLCDFSGLTLEKITESVKTS